MGKALLIICTFISMSARAETSDLVQVVNCSGHGDRYEVFLPQEPGEYDTSLRGRAGFLYTLENGVSRMEKIFASLWLAPGNIIFVMDYGRSGGRVVKLSDSQQLLTKNYLTCTFPDQDALKKIFAPAVTSEN